MKKLSLISFAVLACLSLSACGTNSKQAKQDSEASSLKIANSKLKKKAKKQSSKKKHSTSSSSAVSASNQQNNQQQQTQTSKANTTSQSNNNGNSNQDQRPADVPANFKEYTSYTTDGHRMTQWNDAGSYCGDPDVQYDTIRKQTEAGF